MNTIGIIGAMPSELADIREMLTDAAVEKYAGYDFYVCTYKGKKIISACSGIAKVNASVCTQIMIDKFNVDCIINTGVAGGMDSNVKVCDVVISDSVCPHDLELRFLENYPPYHSVFEADRALIDEVCRVCDERKIPRHIGRIVSGEAFVTDNTLKNDICTRLTPLAVDMETAAVGQTAYRNGIPFVSVRCISDNADDEGAMSFDEFEKIAAKRVAEIVMDVAVRL